MITARTLLVTLALWSGAGGLASAQQSPPAIPSGESQTPAPASVVPGERASEASIRQLMEIVHVRQILEQMSEQMETLLDSTLRQQLQGSRLNEEQQRQLDALKSQLHDSLAEMLEWNRIEAMYVRIYQETFTQTEIDGITAFYRTPAGESMLAKMPLVLQRSMAEVQQLMTSMLPRLQQMARQQAEKIKAAGARAGAGS
jgi:hypothetical protein